MLSKDMILQNKYLNHQNDDKVFDHRKLLLSLSEECLSYRYDPFHDPNIFGNIGRDNECIPTIKEEIIKQKADYSFPEDLKNPNTDIYMSF